MRPVEGTGPLPASRRVPGCPEPEHGPGCRGEGAGGRAATARGHQGLQGPERISSQREGTAEVSAGS